MNQEKVANKLRIEVIREQARTGVNAKLKKQWRAFLKRYSFEVPVCCEFCTFVGEAQWHCHCDDSPKNHINVMPWNVCSEWEPNVGLIMYVNREGREM